MAKVILYKSKKLKDDTHPIVIRWYENGKQRVFTVGSCTEKQWNADKGQVKKNHPFADQINEKIKERLGQAILDGGIKKEISSVSMLEFIEEERQKGIANGSLVLRDKLNQISTDLLEWKKSVKNISMDDFSESNAEAFYLFLRGKGNNKNTTAKKMGYLKTVFNNARKKKITQNDPFLNLSFPRESVTKAKLTRDELTKLEEVDLSKNSKPFNLARDIFILQFYTRGIRIGDALSLEPKNIEGDRFVFREGKTGAHRNIPIHSKVQEIIEKYKGDSIYLLPILRYRHDKNKTASENMLLYKKSIESATAVINRCLKKIGEGLEIKTKITTHIARHSFAKIAIDTVKNIRISQELLGHSSLRVHQDYIKDLQDNDELDNAAVDIYG